MPAKLVETLPAAWYCDPEIYEAERRRIFARNWHLIANGGRLARPGSYVTGDVAGWPVFAVRDRHGELRAFHNVCRHRAGPIFNDEGGVCRALRCRYHGWLYGFDGVLRYAPGIAEPETLDKASLSLFPVRVETWQDLSLCVSRSGDAVAARVDGRREPPRRTLPEPDRSRVPWGEDLRRALRLEGLW